MLTGLHNWQVLFPSVLKKLQPGRSIERHTALQTRAFPCQLILAVCLVGYAVHYNQHDYNLPGGRHLPRKFAAYAPANTCFKLHEDAVLQYSNLNECCLTQESFHVA